MGNWMFDAKRKAASVDSKKTERIDLPEKGYLSSILIRMNAKNGGTANENNHLHECVTKIEVVGAGGETLKSVTGVQAQALAAFDGGITPWGEINELADQYNQEQFVINFGRHLLDTEYMLDCSKVIDGQLKITWDLATVRALAATAYLGTDQEIDVIYCIPHEWAGPAPKGYMKSTETKAWTSEASGIDYTKIPRDNPIRRIMIRAYESGISPAATLTNIRLNADNGKLVPWDNTLKKLKDLNTVLYPLQSVLKQATWAQNADTKEVNMAYAEDVQVDAPGIRSAYPSAEAFGKVTIGLYDLATPTAIAAEEEVGISAKGYGIHNCVMLPFDKPEIMEEMLLQAQTFGELNLELTQGNAGADVSVLTEEVVRQA